MQIRGHIRSLDGLRGIAILLVLLVHFRQKEIFASFVWGRVAHVGSYGVELFFVLSGFLITGILLDTKGSRNFLGTFYARRVVRIFPLYYGALFVVLGVLPWFARFDAGAVAIQEKQGWLWAHLANWPAGADWDGSNLFLLGHFWSLSVEEHYYLVWPLLVALLPRRWLLPVCLGLVSVGISTRTAGVPWSTLTKIDGLAIGSALAIAVRDYPFRLPSGSAFSWLMAFFGLCSMAFVFKPRRVTLPPAIDALGETAIVCLFALILLACLRGYGSVLLGSGFLVAFGKYSYGIYVIHGIMRPGFEQWFTLGHGFGWQVAYYILATAASFALAWLSFRGMEKHFLKLKTAFEYERKGKVNVIAADRVLSTPSRR